MSPPGPVFEPAADVPPVSGRLDVASTRHPSPRGRPGVGSRPCGPGARARRRRRSSSPDEVREIVERARGGLDGGPADRHARLGARGAVPGGADAELRARAGGRQRLLPAGALRGRARAPRASTLASRPRRRRPIPRGVARVTDYNLIGLIRGSDPALRDEAVVLGAHFDHLGIGKPVEGDSIYNGADDDASGVAAVLAAARALAEAPPRRTRHLPPHQRRGVRACSAPSGTLERPAFPLAEHGRRISRWRWSAGPTRWPAARQALAHRLRALHDGRGASARPGCRSWPTRGPSFRFFERSDNIVFALRGIPAHTLSSFGMHADYHQPSDEVDRIDFAHLAQAADVVTRAARLLADGPRPSWHARRPARRPPRPER